MAEMTDRPTVDGRNKRADARRNATALIDSAAELFVETGVETPVRQIASRAGVTTATIYRHFPTRADLILAVYRRQVEALVTAGTELIDSAPSNAEAQLAHWVDLFVDFLVTKRGMAAALQSNDPCYDPLHAYFLEHVLPVFAQLLGRVDGFESDGLAHAHTVLRAIAAICGAAHDDENYDARQLSLALLAGFQKLNEHRAAPRNP
jgi:AcrR family transcriptional regulator